MVKAIDADLAAWTETLYSFYSNLRIAKFTEAEALVLTAKMIEVTLNKQVANAG